MKLSDAVKQIKENASVEVAPSVVNGRERKNVNFFCIPEHEINEVINRIEKLEVDLANKIDWSSEENQKNRENYQYRRAFEILVKELRIQGGK